MHSAKRSGHFIRFLLPLAGLLLATGLSSAEEYPAAKASCVAPNASNQLYVFSLSLNQLGAGDTQVTFTGTTILPPSKAAAAVEVFVFVKAQPYPLHKFGKPVPAGPDGAYRSTFTVKSSTIPLTGPKSNIGTDVSFFDLAFFGGNDLRRCVIQAVP